MHRAREFLLSWWLLTLLLSGASAVNAAPVPSLYAAVAADADPLRAAQMAMREVLVRLVGSREAADDPALAAIVDDAKRYVQLERSTTRGATQVIFDGAALRSAVTTAGRSIWGPDRPLVWVVLPTLSSAASEELRAQLNAAAQVRGLPIALVSADSTAPVLADAGGTGSSALLTAARRAGAEAALISQPSPSDPQTLQWTLLAAGAEGHWVGGAAVAIDGATDALARAARELDSAPATDIDCRIDGVADLASFTEVLGAVGAAPGVSEVTVRSAATDRLTLHLTSRGGSAALTHALVADHLQAVGSSAEGTLQYRYHAGP